MAGESIEDRAGSGNGDGPRKPGRKSLTEPEREERNEKLIADRVRGRSWVWLSKEYDLSTRTCEEIFAKFREHNRHTYESAEPLTIVHEMLDTYGAITEELAEAAAQASSDSNKIGAINAQMSAMGKMADLMQATGILPKNLGTLRLEIDARILAQKIVRVLAEFDATPEMKRALLQVLDEGDAAPLELIEGDPA